MEGERAVRTRGTRFGPSLGRACERPAKPKMPCEAGETAKVEDGQPWRKDRQDQGQRGVVGDRMLGRLGDVKEGYLTGQVSTPLRKMR